MQSAQPVRRRTPLNLYVAYLRANGGGSQDDRTDALIKMLQELKPEHPEEVSRTAQAAAEIAGEGPIKQTSCLPCYHNSYFSRGSSLLSFFLAYIRTLPMFCSSHPEEVSRTAQAAAEIAGQ